MFSIPLRSVNDSACNNPRHVFGEHTAPGRRAEHNARKAVDDEISMMHTPEDLVALVRAIGMGNAVNDQSHLLIHMHSSYPYDSADPEWPTAYVRNKVMLQLTSLYETKLRLFLAATRGVGEYGALRGLLFEWFAHERLAAGGSFTIELLTHKSTETKQQLITLPRSDVFYWSDVKMLQGLSANQYALPISRSQGAFDAAQQPNRFFQMTVAKSHNISTYHLAAGVQNNLPRHSPQFIFVVPTDVYPRWIKMSKAGEQASCSEGSRSQAVRTAP